jgi:L-lactate permease
LKPVSLLGISPDAWVGFVGAVIGGSFTLSAQMLNGHFQRKTAKEAAAGLVVVPDHVVPV